MLNIPTVFDGGDNLSWSMSKGLEKQSQPCTHMNLYVSTVLGYAGFYLTSLKLYIAAPCKWNICGSLQSCSVFIYMGSDVQVGSCQCKIRKITPSGANIRTHVCAFFNWPFVTVFLYIASIESTKRAYDRMATEEPQQAIALMKGLMKPAGAHKQARRDYKLFFTSITTWNKSKEKRFEESMLQCDKDEFKMHWKSRGRKKPVIAKLWKTATSGKKFRKGHAWKVDRGVNKKGKKRKPKTMVYVKEQARVKDSNIVSHNVSQKRGEEELDEEAAKHSMKRKLTLDKDFEAELGYY